MATSLVRRRVIPRISRPLVGDGSDTQTDLAGWCGTDFFTDIFFGNERAHRSFDLRVA